MKHYFIVVLACVSFLASSCSQDTVTPIVSEGQIQTVIAETYTAEAAGEFTKGKKSTPGGIGEISTVFPVAATMTAMAGGGIESEQTLENNTVHVGVWEIAINDFEVVADFNGKLPEEGHEFHAINIQVLNRNDKPQFFSPGVLGSFKVVWEEFSYPSIGFDSLEGYIPPGWPINAKIILDLPSIVDNPIYALQPKGTYDTSEQIKLNNLGSTFVYEKPLIKNLGDVFEIPGIAAITPNMVRTILINYGNYHNNHLLLLDSTVKNLYGHDITLNFDTKIIFQLFSAGRIIPITVSGDDYFFPGSIPNYTTKWHSPPPESISDPFEILHTEPISPGIVKEGSFWLNIWGQSQPSRDMILLIMHESPVGYSSQITDWALYKLSDNAASLLEHPIAKPEIENIALIEAQRLIDDGNWAAAAVILGNAKLNNPGNVEISSKLEEVQQHSGLLILQENENLLSRKLGSKINETSIFYEISEIEQYHNYDLHASPDGNKILIFDHQDHNNIDVIDKSSGQENHLVVNDTLESNSSRRFLSWSPSNDRFILLDDWLSQLQNLIIVNVDDNSTKVLSGCEEAQIGSLAAWSPNEDKIAYIGDFQGRVEEQYLYVDRIVLMDLETGDCSIIHESEFGIQGDWLSPKLGWSSDGNFIYFGFENKLNRISLTDFSTESLTPEYYENVDHVYMGFDGRNLIYDVFLGDVFLFDTKTNQVYRIENEIDLFELRNWVP